MKWFELRKVDDDLNDLPDWLPRESAPGYTPTQEGPIYYDGQILGADVLAESFEEAKKRADELTERFLNEL